MQDNVHRAVNSFFWKQGLRMMDLPITTGSISSPMGLGSDSTPVQIDLFGRPTYLADSMQFMLEFGCRVMQTGVAYKMISFRGERCDQTHLSQFQHAECEIPGDLDDVMALGGQLVHHLSRHLLSHCPDTVRRLAGGIKHLERCVERRGKFFRLRVGEANRELKKIDPSLVSRHPAGFELPTRKGEKMIVDNFGEGLAVWITHFDSRAVPFYQASDPSAPGQAMNADLLLGCCEALGAGQRHRTSAEVRKSLQMHGIGAKPYRWYVQMRDICSIQTSGFGLGLERYLLWALQLSDIRDCALLHRDNGVRCNP